MNGQVGIFQYDAKLLNVRQVERLREIAPYFDRAVLLNLLVPIAMQTFDVSLRVLDYTCTNYAKKTRVLTDLETINGIEPVHVFSLYKDWLRRYRRKTFDPFRRRERVYFHHPDDDTLLLTTTVAQLNFLRWANTYGIIGYVQKHMKDIEQDMIQTLNESRLRRLKNEGKNRRSELSCAPATKCMIYEFPVNVRFDV